MGSLVKKKNELSAEVGQLFLIKSCQSQWKVFEKKSTTKQWRGRRAKIRLDGVTKTKADLHDLEDMC